MDFNLRGKTAIVSGASSGIGFAAARLFAQEGARLVITARTPATLEEARARLAAECDTEIVALPADMTSKAGVSSIIQVAEERFGTIDIGIANVVGHKIIADGNGPPPGHFDTVGADQYRVEFRQLVLSAWYLANALAPKMRQRGWGRLLSIGSGVARESAWHLPHILPNTARPAAAGLFRSLAARYSGTGVTLNSILTGNISTERNRQYMTWLAGERGQTVEETILDNCQHIPLQRPGKPEEMAAVIAFLCSPAANCISGQSLHVDGGYNRHIY